MWIFFSWLVEDPNANFLKTKFCQWKFSKEVCCKEVKKNSLKNFVNIFICVVDTNADILKTQWDPNANFLYKKQCFVNEKIKKYKKTLVSRMNQIYY